MTTAAASQYPEVNQVLAKLGLPIWEVLENGPRYVVVSTDYQGESALFKMVVPGAEHKAPTVDSGLKYPTLLEDVRKEVALLEYLSTAEQRLVGLVPKLLGHGEVPGSAWYIRELIHGTPMGRSDQPFLFTDKFYAEVEPRWLVEYFRSLHGVSALVPAEVASHFQLWYPRADHARLLAQSMDSEWSHPQMRRLAGRLGPWLEQYLPRLHGDGRVIAHNEPFSPHIFVEDGRIGLIDWESASWGHRLHDFSKMWLRFFDHESFRKKFEIEVEAAGYLGADGSLEWDLCRLIESVGTLNHYYNNHELSPHKEQQLYDFLIETISQIAGRRT
jgi:aminoglycoside phosphotransferase (APT) family kinase protein